MKIEQQVCSLELAKRLKKLEVEQESLYYWWHHCNKVHQGYENAKPEYEWVLQADFRGLNHEPACSAFTVAELGEMLPMVITIEHYICLLHTQRTMSGDWFIRYESSKKISKHFVADTEANARAKCLTYLLEINYTQNHKRK